jgi:hypothetical protein
MPYEGLATKFAMSRRGYRNFQVGEAEIAEE